MRQLKDLTIQGKRLLMRLDLNVPVKDGRVLDDTRIRASIPSIQYCLAGGAQLILMSHFGRPQAGKTAAEQPEFSLKPLAAELAKHLYGDGGQEVGFAATLAAAAELQQTHDCVLLENTRFLPGETENDPALAMALALLCDIFVMDAFGSAHRAHASTAGVTQYAKQSCAGLLLSSEVAALDKVLDQPQRPLLAVVGGAKVGDKLKLLERIAGLADMLIVGGGIANTFLAASGHEVGRSLYEPDLQQTALAIMQQTKVLLPVDVVAAAGLESPAGRLYNVADESIQQELRQQMILDVGPKSLANYRTAIDAAKTILWNGPLGVFEKSPFAAGTKALVEQIAKSAAYSVAGGGETVAAINKFGGQVGYLSTGGGAFLEYVEQGTLIAIKALD